MSDAPDDTGRYDDNDLPDNVSHDNAGAQETGDDQKNNSLPSPPSSKERDSLLSWLWHHIGVISGLIIAFLAVASVVFLAIAGFTDALVLLVIVVFGMAMIIVGGRIRSK